MKAIAKMVSYLLIVCIMLAAMQPITALADTGSFTITMPQSVQVDPGETISVPVCVGHTAGVVDYNSFDMRFTYDPSLLKLTTTSLSGMSVTAQNGTVRIVRYGDDRKVGTAAFTLTFQALSSGKTTIEAVDAKVGITETAHAQDASAAVVVNGMTVEIRKPVAFDIDVAKTNGGTVSVSPDRASAGERVEIQVTPRSGYRLKTLTVADANGKNIPVSTDNNGKYSFVMPDGKVTVKVTFTEKSVSAADKSNPKTGDDFNLAVWNAAATFSLLALAVLIVNKKKSCRK